MYAFQGSKMNRLLYILLGIAALILTGCTANIIPEQNTIYYKPLGHRFFSLFEHSSSSEKPKTQASIGDSLFYIWRFDIQDNGVPTIENPWHDPYPTDGQWYSNESVSIDGNTYRVFKNNSFYEASTGVMLDDYYRVISKPFIKLIGVNKGKRWKTTDSDEVGAFFFMRVALIDKWGVRYAGKDNGFYKFETYARSDANVSTVTQSIKISEKEFMEGFVIRGVKITGTSRDSNGVINFTIDEKFKENLDSDRKAIDEFIKSPAFKESI